MGPGAYTLCASLGTILAMSSATASRLTPAPRVTSTSAGGSGVSSKASPQPLPSSLN